MSALPEIKEPVMMTETQYLEFERASEFKHEFVAGKERALRGMGEVVAMSGASEAHNLISGNVLVALKTQLRKRPCKVYPSDMRVWVHAIGSYSYPDVGMVCGEARFAENRFDTLLNPTVIIEVLSPSTEGHDRGRKFQDYRAIASLREYLLIAQDSPRIERFLRRDDGKWELTDVAGLDAALELPTIDCTLSLAEVYEQVMFAGETDES